MSEIEGTTADVIIVGGGLAGASAAVVLGRQGVRVTLVDQRSIYPSCFKAEKIEPDQADTLRRLGMLEVFTQRATRIREVLSVRDGRVFGARNIEQYGMYYGEMVNAVRRSIPAAVDVLLGRVENITTSSDLQRVTLESGAVLTSQLVVLATGTMSGPASQLGLQREMVSKDHSMAFGFTIARRDGRPFDFDALTYYPNGYSTRISCLSLFPMGKTVRANLFVFRSAHDEWVREFVRQPHAQLDASLPKLSTFIGSFEIVSKVESGRIDLYRVQGHRRPGLALVGDALQSVCPSTGTGLSKVFTDVEALCHDCVPAWLETPGMALEKIVKFYDHRRKRTVDTHSLKSGIYGMHVATASSLRWRMAAALTYWQRWLT